MLKGVNSVKLKIVIYVISGYMWKEKREQMLANICLNADFFFQVFEKMFGIYFSPNRCDKTLSSEFIPNELHQIPHEMIIYPFFNMSIFCI